MKLPRQIERREGFQSALATMPYFETWDVEIPVISPQCDPDLIDEALLALYPHPNKVIMGGSVTVDEDFNVIKRQDLKVVPRRTRRSMARGLANRQWRATKGLPEPREAR